MKRSKAFERAVSDLFNALNIPYRRVDNYVCYKCHTVQNSNAAGLPDYLAFPNGRILAVECKTGKGRLSPVQNQVKKYFEAAGVTWLTLHDTLDDLLTELGAI